MMSHLRRYAWAGAASLFVAATLVASVTAQKADKDPKDNPDAKRPQVKLKAQPVIAMAPARVVLTAELVGGANRSDTITAAGEPEGGPAANARLKPLRSSARG